jgi:hypothetical protein
MLQASLAAAGFSHSVLPAVLDNTCMEEYVAPCCHASATPAMKMITDGHAHLLSSCCHCCCCCPPPPPQVSAVVREVSGGRWSPAALMVVIEAAALVHTYTEMASGVTTLLHLGA